MSASRTLLLCLSYCVSLAEGKAQTGWSVLDIPASGRYDDAYFINADTGWAAGGPNGWIRRTVNAGQSWTLQFTSPYYLRSIEFLNADTGFAGSLSGRLYRTTDGGSSWSNIAGSMAPPPLGICGLAAAGGTTIHACGLWAAPAYVYSSADAGSTWSYTDLSGLATRLVDIHFTHPDTGFATGTADPAVNGGVILRTTDGGATWNVVHQTNTLTDIVWKIQRLTAQLWYASIYSEPTNDDTRMLRSADGGITWEQVLVSDEYTYVEAIGFIDPLRGWTGGGDQLWETIDGGATWTEIILGDSYNRFFKVNDSTAYLTGQKVYKYQGDLTTQVSTEAAIPRSHTLRVTPNPSDGRIEVEVMLDRRTIADLRIVNASGSTVRQLLRSNDAAQGPHRFIVDLSREGIGTYLVVLKTNEGMRWEKAVMGK
jgi:photosystem II stability/assembly factor-like uncharacterized protein